MTGWKPSPRALVGLSALIVVILLAALGALLLSHAISKAHVEQLASNALGYDVAIRGRFGVGLLPAPHVSAADVHLQRDGVDVLSAEDLAAQVQLLSLIHRPLRVAALTLQHVAVSLEQNADGSFNIASHEGTGADTTVQLSQLRVADATLIYRTARAEPRARFEHCDLKLEDVQIEAGKGRVLQRLSATGSGSCQRIQTPDMQLSDVKFSLQAASGKYDFKPITLHAYGGTGGAELHADLQPDVPAYRLQYRLDKFHIEQWLRVFSPKRIASGLVDITADLSLRGRSVGALKQSSAGELSLRGQDLSLEIANLDADLSRYESSQSFNLVDVGAVLLGGPGGLLVTKGYDFARLLHGSPGTSPIKQFVSEWRVDQGIAKARDVAMSTDMNRVAVKGNLDLVNARIDDVTVALIDARGCARVAQKIHGPFRQPEVDKSNVLMALGGPARRLIAAARKTLAGSRCEAFYTGSLPPP